jgi:hypothetical protein
MLFERRIFRGEDSQETRGGRKGGRKEEEKLYITKRRKEQVDQRGASLFEPILVSLRSQFL